MEVSMWSIKSGVMVVAALLVCLGGTAGAATVQVMVPFPFQLHGQMLPAGQYLLTSDSNGVVEIEGVRGTRGGMFTMTTPASGHDPAGEKPALTFQRYETQYRLATIWTSGTEGFAIAGR
jgi:hypothetical protein